MEPRFRDVIDTRLSRVIKAAKTHGKYSEPAHELGDLEQALWAAWHLMTPSQHEALMISDVVKEILSWEEFPKKP